MVLLIKKLFWSQTKIRLLLSNEYREKTYVTTALTYILEGAIMETRGLSRYNYFVYRNKSWEIYEHFLSSMTAYKQSCQETPRFLNCTLLMYVKLACFAELIENQFNPLEAEDSLKIKETH